MGSDHQITTAYSHQENALVGRANKEVLRHLRAIIFNQKVITRWSLALPLLQSIINAELNSNTGCAPAQSIFGNSIDLDRGILLSFIPEGNNTTLKLCHYGPQTCCSPKLTSSVWLKNASS